AEVELGTRRAHRGVGAHPARLIGHVGDEQVDGDVVPCVLRLGCEPGRVLVADRAHGIDPFRAEERVRHAVAGPGSTASRMIVASACGYLVTKSIIIGSISCRMLMSRATTCASPLRYSRFLLNSTSSFGARNPWLDSRRMMATIWVVIASKS